MMTKKRWLLSLIPILGSFFHTFHLFLNDKKKIEKSIYLHILSMFVFFSLIVIFILVCNAISFEEDLFIILFYAAIIIFGIIWNLIYYLMIAKIEKTGKF